MGSLKINVDVQGHEILFLYQFARSRENIWTATICDECQTIEEHLLAPTQQACFDEAVGFLLQLGSVISVTPASIN